ncbi:MAG: SNF2-related protein, partial [Parachlamydia sp.]|nr:SNF2-related protein [Parachlamydia sp.]
MLNFRKLRHDVSPAILKEGKSLYDKGMVVSTKINQMNADSIRFSCRVMGGFEHCYESEMEIDRHESIVIDSDCDCPYKYDCQHLSAVIFYLETHFNQILVAFSKETDLEKSTHVDDDEKNNLRKTFKEAESKEHARQDKKNQKELLEEYIYASALLGQSSFFLPEEEMPLDKAELAVVYIPLVQGADQIEIQLSLRLPFRSKSLNVSQVKPFLDAIRYNEAIYIGGKRYFFSVSSFDETSAEILKLIIDFARFPEQKMEKQQRSAFIDIEAFGTLLGVSYAMAQNRYALAANEEGSDLYPMPCIYCNTIEEPLRLCPTPSMLRFEINYLEVNAPKILLKPKILLQNHMIVDCEEALLFECAKPGMIHQNIYYSFQSSIKRKHLRSLPAIRKMTIPEPLFGTFVENALPELSRFADVANRDAIDQFVTLPFVEKVAAECDIQYLNGELEASLSFVYGDFKIPAALNALCVDHIKTFVTDEGILARNLTEEQKIIEDLFQDFIYDPIQGLFSAKNEKKIVEFMTEIIPANQSRVQFNCPENLLDQFIYDDTTFTMQLRESKRVDMYEVDLKVEGYLNGVTIDLLWDCLSAKRAFIELSPKKKGRKKTKAEETKAPYKILVLDLEKLAPVIQIFDEMGINQLDDHVEQRPLWSLASLDVEQFINLPISFSMTGKLKEIQAQMLGELPCDAREIPSVIQASLRNYQVDGIRWLDRLRGMHLNGILADDMGLGKTLQAIIALTQHKIDFPNKPSIVVCPTSLVYNWKEEIAKFNPNLTSLPVDGNPTQRKKLLKEAVDYDVIITSYTLLQKDIEFYKSISFGYAILDEAQHIKNRSTRNALSVKMIQASHRLILTGTPIENSLEELWSLFDFLMPGLLSTYERFVEKYIRQSATLQAGKSLENLKRKVAPFILRRMKKDVLEDLPPVSEIVYHCHLSDVQQKLYRSYAASARQELSQLVKKEGFDRVQIHVLATLTRLKQICCHPAIFAKDKA